MWNILNREGSALLALMSEAKKYALAQLETYRTFSGTFFTDGPDGRAIFREADSLKVDRDAPFGTIARAVCYAEDAQMCVFVSIAEVNKVEMINPLPWQTDEVNGVIIMGESREELYQEYFPMLFNPNETFAKLERGARIDPDGEFGRKYRFLADKIEDSEMRMLSRTYLEKVGYSRTTEWDQFRALGKNIEENVKCNVISPDGVPLTMEPFKNKAAALAHTRKWCDSLEKHQGYYSTAARIHIPMDELPNYLELVPENKTVEETAEVLECKEKKRERGRGMSI